MTMATLVAALCLSALAVGVCGCTFQLDDVEAMPPPRPDASTGETGAGINDASKDGAVIQDGAMVADAGQDAAKDSAPDTPEACSAPPDSTLCSQLSFKCGVHPTVDVCGQNRDLNCGACAADSHCEQGVCVAYTYSWVTGTWSACSTSCGGGQKTLEVWCKRDDGQVVADAMCAGAKPATTDACNSQPCCVTGTLEGSGKACSGSTNDIVNWIQFHFGSDTGSVADRADCAAQCTAWATAKGMTSWCCDLVEDSGTGTSWACAAHTGPSIGPHSASSSNGSYAGLGSCQTP